MLDLKIKLEQNKNYINFGNIFSKNLILVKNITSGLIILDSEQKIQHTQKIFEYLGKKTYIINSLSSIYDFLFDENGLYLINCEVFDANYGNTRTLENKLIQVIELNKDYNINDLIEKLISFGYTFNDSPENGNFKKIGDVLEIHCFVNDCVYKISFWGNTVDEIIIISGGNIRKSDKVILATNTYFQDYPKGLFNTELLNIIGSKLVILDELDLEKNYDELCVLENKIILNSFKNPNINQINLDINELSIKDIDQFLDFLSDSKFKNKLLLTKSLSSISNFIDYHNIVGVDIKKTENNLLKSFIYKDYLVVCDDIISKIFVKKRIKRSVSANLDLLLQIKPGDFIVHSEHGIGKFRQILEKDLSGIKKEYLEIEYDNNDCLFVPITEVNRISKYVGEDSPSLSSFDSKKWQKNLEKAEEDVEKIAIELLDIYASREVSKGFPFGVFKSEEQAFVNSFPYTYTPDQQRTIDEIFVDMESQKPMERLVIGDVGFGKTEVAFNAAYKAFLNKKQTILISPLVVLTYEHYEKALDRFKNMGLRVGVLTRFEKAKVAQETIRKISTGELDLIIGTHRLLNENIVYKDLGLLVVDEEHKFGVKDKESIKKLKSNIDVLSLSATPIPRSLNFALSGIKEFSILTTPPVGRKAVETYISKSNDETIKQAGIREFSRGGQLFFIHNRVEDIDKMYEYLKGLFPDKTIVITHGQLHGDELENRIIDFKRKKYDILLSTTVIENGIDFENVNTIIINNSTNFGISQIHQLRGRVGRRSLQGYCYLLYSKDKIEADAAKRLKTIVEYSHLGAGFELAIKDLEIRGGGDILGIKQSGQARLVGLNLFLEMLEEKIQELKNEDTKQIIKIDTAIDLNISAFIPNEYFSGELDKLNFYREIESLTTIEDLNSIIDEFSLINPDFIIETQNLFDVLKLKIYSYNHEIKVIKRMGINYQIDFKENATIDKLKEFLSLDKKVLFNVVSATRLRADIKNFKNDLDFATYLLNMYEPKKDSIGVKRIKLKNKTP